jgi:hypothetical protein
MDNTLSTEVGQAWPRRYTSAEIDVITAALGTSIDSDTHEKLQQEVEGYQWASLADEGSVFLCSTNKGVRYQLNCVLNLLLENATDETINIALNELDGLTRQRLGRVGTSDRRRLARAVRRVIKSIPDSAPDRKRGRRQYIAGLACIFQSMTNVRPSRYWDGKEEAGKEEKGRFTAVVKAALTPFKATQGCAADIKHIVNQRKKVAAGARKTGARKRAAKTGG